MRNILKRKEQKNASYKSYKIEKREILSLKSFTNHHIMYFIPIFLALSIIPVITKLLQVNYDSSIAVFFATSDYDYYGEIRTKALICIGVLAVILFLVSIVGYGYDYIKDFRKFKWYFICAGVFLLFTTISSLCSDNIEVSLWGFRDQGEGLIHFTLYIVLFFISIFTVTLVSKYSIEIKNPKIKNGKKNSKIFDGEYSIFFYIITPLLIVLLINIVVGFLQYNDIHLTDIDFFEKIIMGEYYGERVATYTLGSSSVYGTLYNPNHTGVVAVIMVFLVAGMIFVFKSIYLRIFFSWLLAISLVFLELVNSDGARIGAITGFIVIFLFFIIPVIKRHFKIALSVVGVLLILLVAVGLTTSVFTKISDKISANFNSDDYAFVKELSVNDDGNLYVLINEDEYVLTKNESSIGVYKNGVIYESVGLQQWLYFFIDDVDTDDFSFLLGTISDEKIVLYVNYYYSRAEFEIDANGDFYFISPYTDTAHEIDNPSLAFSNINTNLGSNRIYIWSRSVPLIWENLIIGAGPGHFVFEFPQYDFIGKAMSYIEDTAVFTKPHNMYLQTIINNGGVAFLALMGIIGMYIVDSVKIYYNKKLKDKFEILGFFHVYSYNRCFCDSIFYRFYGLLFCNFLDFIRYRYRHKFQDKTN